MNAGQMNRLGIDGQTVFGMPPIEHIMLASDLECGHISTGLGPVPWKLQRFPQWSLRDNSALRREMTALMRDRGVVFAQGDGCIIRSEFEVRNYASDLDLFAELGALQISTVAMEPDASRAQAQLALLAEMADQRGMGLTLEFAPPHSINTFEKALSAIRIIAKPNVRLTIDAMHFFRSGGGRTRQGCDRPQSWRPRVRQPRQGDARPAARIRHRRLLQLSAHPAMRGRVQLTADRQ
jgi:hypothetical protein